MTKKEDDAISASLNNQPEQLATGGGKDGLLFPEHPERRRALDEVHSRPTPQIPCDRLVLHYAFMAEGGNSINHAILSELAESYKLEPIPKSARYRKMDLPDGILRWERHSEFSTYMWETDLPKKFGDAASVDPFTGDIGTPGSLISATRVEIRKNNPTNMKLLDIFRASSCCVSRIDGTDTLIATDFRQNERGETVYLVLDGGMSKAAIGSLVKKLIEIETYRTLALLGLPLAHSLSGEISKIEVALSKITADMRDATPDRNRELLEEISDQAANLEAGAAASLFRFGASRAYGDIVEERLAMLNGRKIPSYHNLEFFLERRLGPALRTCRSVEYRQSDLSRKLARAANLLRTRIEVEIEEQNRVLLTSMDRRAQLQLRLQQTVEGLSVAAVSYYMVGLFYYLAQALIPYSGLPISPKMAAGMFAPIAILTVWWMVRRIRKNHSDDH